MNKKWLTEIDFILISSNVDYDAAQLWDDSIIIKTIKQWVWYSNIGSHRWELWIHLSCIINYFMEVSWLAAARTFSDYFLGVSCEFSRLWIHTRWFPGDFLRTIPLQNCNYRWSLLRISSMSISRFDLQLSKNAMRFT